MSEFFLTLLNMSVVSSLLIVAVMLLRLVFKKAPKAIICILWALVGLRLVCPFSFESKLSLVPEKEPVTYIAEQAQSDKNIEEYIGTNQNNVNYETPQGSVSVSTQSSAEFDLWALVNRVLPYVWGGGVLAMAISSVISYVRLRKSMLACFKMQDNIYLCDGIKSPFILGVIKPGIYIPSHLNSEEQRVVIAHETAHLKRLDYLWKPLGFLVLTVHWFNPLVWLAYALLCRDIEGACDEYVVKKMSVDDKKLYSYTLLSCSAPRHMLTACPVAFGEVNVKSRVKSVLNYKKPAFWIVIASVVSIAVVAVLFMTNPVEDKNKGFETPEELIHSVIMEKEKYMPPMYPDKDSFACESHYVFDVEESENSKTYYLWVAYMEYALNDEKLLDGGGGVGPKVITMTQNQNGTYSLLEYWEPLDGEKYGDSVREKFPKELHNRVFYGTSQDCVMDEVYKQASEHFGVEDSSYESFDEYPRFSGRILKVTDKYYLIAPLEGEVIMGQTTDKVYVYHGGEDEFIEDELVLVSYNKFIEESYPPYLPSINSITLMIENFRPTDPADTEFYRTITENGDEKASAVVDVTQAELKNIEIFRFTPEYSRSEKNVYTDGAVRVFHENFSPYIFIDNSAESASFAYSEGCFLTGHFTKTDDGLTIAYHDYYACINDLGRRKLQFIRTDEGYILDARNSDFPEPFCYEVDGKICEKLPENAVFENDYDLEVK